MEESVELSEPVVFIVVYLWTVQYAMQEEGEKWLFSVE